MNGKTFPSKGVLLALIIAALSFAIGAIGKLFSAKLYMQNETWHMVAQTALLFAIAWGINKYLSSSKE